MKRNLNFSSYLIFYCAQRSRTIVNCNTYQWWRWSVIRLRQQKHVQIISRLCRNGIKNRDWIFGTRLFRYQIKNTLVYMVIDAWPVKSEHSFRLTYEQHPTCEARDFLSFSRTTQLRKKKATSICELTAGKASRSVTQCTGGSLHWLTQARIFRDELTRLFSSVECIMWWDRNW